MKPLTCDGATIIKTHLSIGMQEQIPLVGGHKGAHQYSKEQ